MSRWFRFYPEAMRSPRVLRLSDKDFRAWVKLLCIAGDRDGKLPEIGVLKSLMGMRSDHLSTLLSRLLEGGLIDPLEGGYIPRDWNKYQYKSDSSTERVRKHRAEGNVSETPPDTETDTEKNKEARSALAFEGSVIRLNEQDFTRWRVAYGYLDLRAELQTRDDWLAHEADEKTRKNWFIPTSNYLANRNAKAKADRDSGYSAVMPC